MRCLIRTPTRELWEVDAELVLCIYAEDSNGRKCVSERVVSEEEATSLFTDFASQS